MADVVKGRGVDATIAFGGGEIRRNKYLCNGRGHPQHETEEKVNARTGEIAHKSLELCANASVAEAARRDQTTTAGFVGFFGYVGRVIQGKGIGWIAQHDGWEAALWSVVGCTVLGIILLAFLWNVRPRG